MLVFSSMRFMAAKQTSEIVIYAISRTKSKQCTNIKILLISKYCKNISHKNDIKMLRQIAWIAWSTSRIVLPCTTTSNLFKWHRKTWQNLVTRFNYVYTGKSKNKMAKNAYQQFNPLVFCREVNWSAKIHKLLNNEIMQ